MKILNNINPFAVTFNTEDYSLFSIEDILQIAVKKMKNILIKVIQYIIFEDFRINIGNKNAPALLFDILHCTAIIREASALGFRLGNSQTIGNHVWSVINPFVPTVPTCAVRETASLGIMGAPRVPPLCRTARH